MAIAWFTIRCAIGLLPAINYRPCPFGQGATGVGYFFTDQTGMIRGKIGSEANAGDQPLQPQIG